MFPQRAIALVVPSLVLLAGCPRPRVDFGRDGEARTATEVLKRVDLSELSVLSVKGEARLSVDSPQGKGAVTVFVAALHPSFIHLEQLDFFGRPQTVLVSDGQRFGLYEVQQGRFTRGPASEANLSRFLPISMPPAELVGLLLGRAPRIDAEATQFGFDADRGRYVLTLERGLVAQRLEVTPPFYRVVDSRVAGLPAYDVRFGDLTAIGGVTVPHLIHLESKQAKTTVDLGWKDVSVNETPDLTLFELEVPEGAQVIEVDAKGGPSGG